MGGVTFGGLSLAGLRQLAAEDAIRAGHADRAIFIDLSGGPSHIDSFDPKPNGPSEIRGSFDTIATKIPGIRFSEHLPKLAASTDRFALIRGVSHTLAAHRLGSEYVATGSKPTAALQYPSYGAVYDSINPAAANLPGHVAIPKSAHGAGFLGIRHAARDQLDS